MMQAKGVNCSKATISNGGEVLDVDAGTEDYRVFVSKIKSGAMDKDLITNQVPTIIINAPAYAQEYNGQVVAQLNDSNIFGIFEFDDLDDTKKQSYADIGT
jgi:hypothetical protein